MCVRASVASRFSGFTISQIGGIIELPAVTRRRDPDARQQAWLIHYGSVQVGTIAERTGNPTGWIAESA